MDGLGWDVTSAWEYLKYYLKYIEAFVNCIRPFQTIVAINNDDNFYNRDIQLIHLVATSQANMQVMQSGRPIHKP